MGRSVVYLLAAETCFAQKSLTSAQGSPVGRSPPCTEVEVGLTTVVKVPVPVPVRIPVLVPLPSRMDVEFWHGYLSVGVTVAYTAVEVVALAELGAIHEHALDRRDESSLPKALPQCSEAYPGIEVFAAAGD